MASAEFSSRSELRSGFLPFFIGLMGPTPDSDQDRIVLVNPVTQGMIVLRGDAATISELLLSGGGGANGGAPPASKASIESMKLVEEADVGEEEECSICLDELRKVEVKEMPCRHRFHGVCIGKWLKVHGSCPVCRFLMPVEEGEGGNKEEGEQEGEMLTRTRRGEREVWVTIAVSRREREEDQVENHQQQPEEEEEEHQRNG